MGFVASAWVGLALVVGIGLAFAARQNRAGGMGGRISRAKQIWLIWAVYAWFVLAPLLAAAPLFSARVRIVLGVFAGFMALRGVVELFMLYVTKNWRPPLGIAHDLSCVVLLLLGLLWVRLGGPIPEGPARWGPLAIGVLTVSLGLETYYALSFHRVVAGQTTGEDGVWFASAEEARFDRVNRITALANGPLVLALLALLIAWTVAA